MYHLLVPFEIRHVNEVAIDHISPQRMRPKSRFVIGETLWSKSSEARLDLKLTWLHMPGDVTNPSTLSATSSIVIHSDREANQC